MGTGALIRGLATVAAAGLMLASAQLAGAQQPPGGQPPPTGNQPPTGSQPPPGAQPPQGADLSTELRNAEDVGSRLDEGERVTYEAHVVNHGPGTARGVKVIVSTSEDFDLDEVNHEGECQTNPGEEGRMVCSYGDLPPGTELRLKFRGAFRDRAGHTRTNVYVEGLSSDPDPTNNHNRQGERVHDNAPAEDFPNAPAEDFPDGPCAGTLTLSGGLDPEDPIAVDDDLEVFLRGETIFEDNDEISTIVDPITFTAANRDELRVVASNSDFFDGAEFLDELFLHCDDGRIQVLDDDGFARGGSNPPGETFFDRTFSIDF